MAANFGRVGDALRAVATGKALERRGHQVTVLYSRSDHALCYRRIIEDNIEIVETPRAYNINRWNGFHNPYTILVNTLWLLTHTYDVIHAFVPVDNVGLPWLLKKSLCSKSIYIYDQSDLVVDGGFLGSDPKKFGPAKLAYRLAAWTEQRVKINADAVFVLSTRLYKRAVSQGVEVSRLHLIRTGIMVSQLLPPLDNEKAREIVGLPKDAFLLGFASLHLAGLDELVDGAINLAKRGFNYRIIFSGKYNETLREKIRIKGLDQYFYFTGWLDDDSFWVMMSACDAFLTLMDDTLLNQYCFPSKLLNYMAIGRPVIVTDIGDAGDFVRERGFGFAYPVGGANLAEAVIRIKENPELAVEMGQLGREVVLGEYSWEQLSCRIEEIYGEARRLNAIH
jgi:glycosyltransferase involved in cell wall biosynthesis